MILDLTVNLIIDILVGNMKNKYNFFLDPIVLAGIFGLMIAVYFLFMAQKNSNLDEIVSKPIGHIESFTESVKIKPTGHLHWNLAAKHQKLGAGDYIFTGEKSRTVINLDNQGTLIIGPYSMIIVQPSFIQVESGEIELLASKDTVIKSFGQSIKVSPKSSTKIINTTSDKQILLSEQDKLLPGNAEIEQKILTENKLLVEEATESDPDRPIELRMEGLDEKWESPKGALLVTFASDVRFDQVKLTIKNGSKTREFKGSRGILLEAFPEGTYEAQASAYLDNKLVAESLSKTLRVVMPEVKTPKIRSPKKEFEFFF